MIIDSGWYLFSQFGTKFIKLYSGPMWREGPLHKDLNQVYWEESSQLRYKTNLTYSFYTIEYALGQNECSRAFWV